MKFAIAFPADQTIVYLADKRESPISNDHVILNDDCFYLTTKYAEARLFDDRQETEAVIDTFLVMYETECWIEEVVDESEFRKQPDTW